MDILCTVLSRCFQAKSTNIQPVCSRDQSKLNPSWIHEFYHDKAFTRYCNLNSRDNHFNNISFITCVYCYSIWFVILWNIIIKLENVKGASSFLYWTFTDKVSIPMQRWTVWMFCTFVIPATTTHPTSKIPFTFSHKCLSFLHAKRTKKHYCKMYGMRIHVNLMFKWSSFVLDDLWEGLISVSQQLIQI